MSEAQSRYQALIAAVRSRIREIRPVELRRLQRDCPAVLIIDVRETEELNDGRIPGALHLTRGTIEQRIEKWAPELATPIVCYCASGNRSALVAESLAAMGYLDVCSLAGGVTAWIDAGLPLERDPGSSR